jgi:hypothetical protein
MVVILKLTIRQKVENSFTFFVLGRTILLF